VQVVLAGLAELGGGLMLALGLLTPLAAAAIIGVMVVAIATVHLPGRSGSLVARRGARPRPGALVGRRGAGRRSRRRHRRPGDAARDRRAAASGKLIAVNDPGTF
jgi:hypothetical protein